MYKTGTKCRCLTLFKMQKIPDGFSLSKRLLNVCVFFLSGERLMIDATCIIQEEVK